jgi:hypothetical protein
VAAKFDNYLAYITSELFFSEVAGAASEALSRHLWKKRENWHYVK